MIALFALFLSLSSAAEAAPAVSSQIIVQMRWDDEVTLCDQSKEGDCAKLLAIREALLAHPEVEARLTYLKNSKRFDALQFDAISPRAHEKEPAPLHFRLSKRAADTKILDKTYETQETVLDLNLGKLGDSLEKLDLKFLIKSLDELESKK